jgi:putative MATE family efflux protein
VPYTLGGVSLSRRDLDRRIARLAIPAVGAIAAEPLYNLADTAIVGHLGREPLDALALAASTLSVVVWLAIFLQTATTTEVARHAARGQHDAAGRVVGAAYAVAAGWGVVTAAIVAGIAPLLVSLLGGHAATGTAATSYIRVAAGGLPFLYLSYAGNGHLTGLEDTRTPLRIAVGANVVNVTLEVWLVFGLHAGLIGSAWGTVAAQVLAAAAYGYASRRSSYPLRRPGGSEVAALLRDGHRLSVRTIALGVVPLAATGVAARLGPVPLAGQQVAYRLWGLLSLSTDALAVPAQVFVSAALGRGDREAAEQAAHRTLVLGLIAGVGLGVLTAALALVAPAAFTSDPAVRSAAVTGLLWSAVTQPLAAVAFVYDGIILGLGDYSAMRRTMLWAIVAFAPLAALVLRFHWLGLPGVWTALGCWLAARMVMLGRRSRAALQDRAAQEGPPPEGAPPEGAVREGAVREGASTVGCEAELDGQGQARQGDGDAEDAGREVAR